MGQSESSGNDDFALPQQQIISMVDGNATGPPAAQTTTGRARPLQVGSTKEARAVQALLSLHRGGIALNPHGAVTAQVAAKVDGTAVLLAPALEQISGSSPVAQGQDGEDVSWPRVTVEGRGQPRMRRVAKSDRCAISFDGPTEALSSADRRDRQTEIVDGSVRRWPLVILLLPGSSAPAEDPPDGALMTFCDVSRGEIRIVQQFIAWGGNRRAFLIKQLYGIQEVRQSAIAESDDAEADSQKNCVICLTSPKDTALMPCAHLCVCYDCGASIRLSPGRNRCPLCRNDVHDIVRIHMSLDNQISSPSSTPAAVSPPAATSAAVSPPAATSAAVSPPATTAGVSNATSMGTEQSVCGEAAHLENLAEVSPQTSAEPQASEAPANAQAKAQALSTEELRAARLSALEHTGKSGLLNTVPTAASVSSPAAQDEQATLGPKAATLVEALVAPRPKSYTASSSSPVLDGGGSTLPPRCLQRLTREMRQMELQRAKNLQEHGLELDLADREGNDLRIWTLRIHSNSVDVACSLGKELRRLSVPEIVFEVWIPDGFPTSPPKVRVLKPTFNNGSFWVHQYGALCLEILTSQGWSPATSLVQLGVALKNMMSQGNGSISSPLGIGLGDRERAWQRASEIEASHKDWGEDPLRLAT